MCIYLIKYKKCYIFQLINLFFLYKYYTNYINAVKLKFLYFIMNKFLHKIIG